MPDLAVEYVLTPPHVAAIAFNSQDGTPGGTRIKLNDGLDGFLLYDIKGLSGGSPRRTPIDNRPQTDASILHDFFKAGRVPTFEGLYKVESTRIEDNIATKWNQMEARLKAVLDDCLDRDAPATLTWTPRGLGHTYSLQVLNNVPLDSVWQPAFLTFTFGLASAAAEATAA
jgi:hypothetical protein